jgi:hypothetical protein
MPSPKRTPIALLLFAGAMYSNAMVQSLAATSPTDPSQPHEKLRFFEGVWTTTDSTPEDSFREKCTWLPEGRRHMVCVSRWKTTSGPREGMSVFSFDPKSSRYVYTGFRSGGGLVVLYGEEKAGRWQFSSDEGTGTSRVRTRVTIEGNNEQGFDFASDRSLGDEPWSQPSRVTYRRVAE